MTTPAPYHSVNSIEEYHRINAEAAAMAEYRKTEEYAREKAKWMEFINAGRGLMKSGVPGVIVK